VAHVVAQVEVRVVDPHGPALLERHEGQALAVAGDEVQARGEGVEDLLVGRRLALEDHDGGDVHVRAARFEMQEGGVESGQSLGLGHVSILTFNKMCCNLAQDG
jgi:hypothetical protein